MPGCLRVTDAPGENHSDKHTHPVCGSSAPRLNPVATWLSWSPSRCWQLSRGEAAVRKAQPWLTPRTELLLPAVRRSRAKHPKKMPWRVTIAGIAMGITVARSTPRPPACKRIPGADATRGAPLSFGFVCKTSAGGQDCGVPLAANLNPKAFSAGQALKTQFQSKALNGCNLS